MIWCGRGTSGTGTSWNARCVSCARPNTPCTRNAGPRPGHMDVGRDLRHVAAVAQHLDIDLDRTGRHRREEDRVGGHEWELGSRPSASCMARSAVYMLTPPNTYITRQPSGIVA